MDSPAFYARELRKIKSIGETDSRLAAAEALENAVRAKIALVESDVPTKHIGGRAILAAYRSILVEAEKSAHRT